MILVAGLLVFSGTTAPAASASRQATSVGGWNTSDATVAPGSQVGSRIRVRSGGRAWSRKVVVQFRRPGGRWRVLDHRVTRRDGRVVARAVPPADGQLRVVVPRTRRASSRATAPRHVVVRRTTMRARSAELASEVLTRVNRLRRNGTTCAGVWQKPVAAVRHHEKLAAASRTYARRMAVHHFFGHSDRITGNGPGWRATAAGYSWSVVGENLAANYGNAADVVRAWRRSPGHCRNLMDGRWRHLGVGWYRAGADAPYANYWGQLFGRP